MEKERDKRSRRRDRQENFWKPGVLYSPEGAVCGVPKDWLGCLSVHPLTWESRHQNVRIAVELNGRLKIRSIEKKEADDDRNGQSARQLLSIQAGVPTTN